MHKKVTPQWKDASDAFRLSAGVTAFAMRLRQSQYQSENSWDLVRTLLSRLKLSDEQGYIEELKQLVKRAQQLAKK